jgi:hypothetical protein
MSEWLGVGAVVLALYGLGGLALVPRDAALFRERLDGALGLAGDGLALGALGKRLVLAQALPGRAAFELTPPQRPPRADDPRAIRSLLERFAAAARWPRRAALALACALAAAAPALFALLGPARAWQPALAAVVAATLATALAYFRAHRALYPERGEERWSRAVAMALLPTDALHAVAALGRPLLAGHSPVAVAVALARERDAAALAGRRLRALRHPTAAERAAGDAAARAAELAALEAWLAARALPVALAPEPAAGAAAFCPRCLVTYSAPPPAECADCGGVALLPHAER